MARACLECGRAHPKGSTRARCRRCAALNRREKSGPPAGEVEALLAHMARLETMMPWERAAAPTVAELERRLAGRAGDLHKPRSSVAPS